MMQIPYLAPAQSKADLDKAQQLVAQMSSLLSFLQKAGGKYNMLTADDRALLKKHGYPAVLVDNLAFFTEQVRLEQGGELVEQDYPMIGFTSAAFNAELYASDAIKSALIKSHGGRCAYCETLIEPTSFGDVEHFRPKAAFTTAAGSALFRPAYFQLAYEPQNLLYACTLCNEAYKKNSFEVIGPRFPDVAVTHEQAVLINPYTEDPRRFIRFNPVSAYAYPFDLVVAFYQQTQKWTAQQTELAIWQDPGKIPGQQHYHGIGKSLPEVDQAFQAWLPAVKEPLLRRGLATISTLGLNRPALVRARAGQLRHLRGLVWATQGSGPDQAAALKLLQSLLANAADTALLIPQYISLCIDALQTWNAQGVPGNSPWLDGYNQILQQQVNPLQQVTPTPSNDALSYMLLESELSLAGQRRLVYISDKDKIYGNPQGRKAIFLAVDWDSEKNNIVLVKRNGAVRQQLTLSELLTQSLGNRSIYRLFEKNELWVVGNFPPFKT